MELDISMVIAEIAVALAGFAAVVANFSENGTKAKANTDQSAGTSGIALFASMVPLIMSQMRAGDSAGIDTVWMVSSASYVFLPPATWLSRCFSPAVGTRARAVDHLSSYVYRGDRRTNLQSLYGCPGVDCLLALLLSLAMPLPLPF